MAARKSPPARKASGENIENWQRHTQQVLLRLQPEIAEMLRASAEAEEMTLAEYVSWLLDENERLRQVAEAAYDCHMNATKDHAGFALVPVAKYATLCSTLSAYWDAASRRTRG